MGRPHLGIHEGFSQIGFLDCYWVPPVMQYQYEPNVYHNTILDHIYLFEWMITNSRLNNIYGLRS